MRRIFIAGEQGQMARALVRIHSALGHQVKTAGRESADVTDEAGIRASILDFRPDLIINAAAYTAVDKAEDETDKALLINRDGARNVARAARETSAPLIHISTDYVFDGTKPTPYNETDLTNPIGAYGKSKLAGETAVAAEWTDHLILRTSWVYSPDGDNFVKKMLRFAKERDEIAVVNDQWGAPTFATDLALAIAKIGEVLLTGPERSALSGVYHATGSGEATWYQFACAVMELSAARGRPACRVLPISTAEYPTRARRPANSRLDNAKLERTFGMHLPAWEDSLERCLDELVGVSTART